jgi:hypothetical protein
MVAEPFVTAKVTTASLMGVPSFFLTSAVTVPGDDALMVELDRLRTTVPDVELATVPLPDSVGVSVLAQPDE